MPNYRRPDIPGGTWFCTVNLRDRRSTLLTDHMDILREALRHVRRNWPLVIEAAVVLPEHLHMLWTLPPGDGDISTRWRPIKSRFSRHIETPGGWRSPSRRDKREREVWQRRFLDHVIRDETDFERHVDYIHWNPVKHGLVERPIDWPYSSLHADVRRGVLSADWGVGRRGQDFELRALDGRAGFDEN